MQTGLENCLRKPPMLLTHGRWGLLSNQASVDTELKPSWERLAAAFPGGLRAMFAPQHGFWGTQQANMDETPSSRHPRLNIPVHSLYAEVRRPTPQMLDGLDCLVVDLQDVGTRVYTFVWTLSYCLETCAENGTRLLVLDRPNPLGGSHAEGPLLDLNFASFVGRWTLPMRHGLTIGEIARLLNEEMKLGADLEVCPLTGWRREIMFPETKLPWVPTSPNLPTWESAFVYPGQVLLEGTNVSEGRGTTTPFQLIGAPFVDAFTLLQRLERFDLEGIRFRPARFIPSFDKWGGQECEGVSIHITDPLAAQPYRAGLAVLAAIRQSWPAEFRWLSPPYEYEETIPPIDIISGSSQLRRSLNDNAMQASADLRTLELREADEREWWARAEPHLLY